MDFDTQAIIQLEKYTAQFNELITTLNYRDDTEMAQKLTKLWLQLKDEFYKKEKLNTQLDIYQFELRQQNEELKHSQEQLMMSHRKYNDLYHFAPIAYLTLNQQGTIVEANLAATKLFKRSFQQLVNKPFVIYLKGQMATDFFNHLRQVFDEGQPQQYELTIQLRDGRHRQVEVQSNLFYDEIHQTSYCHTALVDITARKAAEAALQQSHTELEVRVAKRTVQLQAEITERKQVEQDLRHQLFILRNVSEAIVATDMSYVIQSWNQAAETMYGWSAAEVIGNPLTDFIKVDYPEMSREAIIEQVMETGQWRGTVIHTRRDGQPRYVLSSLTLIHDDTDQPVGILAINRDDTERYQAQQQVAQAERKYRALFEKAPLMYVVTENRHGQLIISDCNEEFLDRLGYELAEVVDQPLTRFYTPESKIGLLEEGYQQVVAGHVYMHERRLLSRTGEVIETILRAIPEYNEAGQFLGTRAMYVDVTERNQAERSLRESEQRYRTLANHIPHSDIYLFDREIRFLIAGGTEMGRWQLKSADFEGRTLREAMGDDMADYLEPIYRQVLTGQEIELDFTFGDQIYHLHILPLRDDQGAVYAGMNLARNITEQKRAEKLLQQNQTRLTLMNNILAQIATTSSLQQVIAYTVDRLHHYFVQYRVSYCTIDAAGILTVVQAIEPPDMLPISGLTADLTVAPIYLKHLQRFDPVLVSNTATDDRLTPLAEAMAAGGTGAVLDIPLFHSKNLVGILAFDAPQPHEWTEHEITTLQEAANHLSLALKNLRAQEEIRENDERLRLVVQNMPVLMDAFDEAGNIIVWNGECERLTGFSAAEIVNNPQAMHLLYPEPAYLETMLLQWQSSEDDYRDWEWEISCKDGTVRTISWFNISANFPIPGWASWGVGVDVTDRKRAETLLRKSQERYQAIVEDQTEFICRWLPDSTLTFVNGAYARYFGFEPADMMGHNFMQQVLPADRPRVQANFDSLSTDQPIINHDHRVYRADGQIRWHHWTNRAIFDEAGQIVELQSVGRDITEQKEAKDALARKVKELARSNKELEQFAYLSSHDMQEPLRKIQAFGDRLLMRYHDQLDDRGQDYIHRMRHAAERMQILINDLLTYSRLHHSPKFIELDLNELIQNVLDDLEITLKESGGRVEVKPLPTIEADRSQMRQLFQNLLSNALKFRRPDAAPVVTITSRPLTDPILTEVAHHLDPLPDGASVCHLTVTDNGIGFEEKYLDRIFAPFQRLHNRAQYAGSGMGLAICHKVVSQHQGEITAISQPGKGTTFIIRLPY